MYEKGVWLQRSGIHTHRYYFTVNEITLNRALQVYLLKSDITVFKKGQKGFTE